MKRALGLLSLGLLTAACGNDERPYPGDVIDSQAGKDPRKAGENTGPLPGSSDPTGDSGGSDALGSGGNNTGGSAAGGSDALGSGGNNTGGSAAGGSGSGGNNTGGSAAGGSGSGGNNTGGSAAGGSGSGGAPSLPTCSDLIRNQDESDVDCGGPCDPCVTGDSCLTGNDCESLSCSSPQMGSLCLPATCHDEIKNGFETDLDCGGGNCPPCNDLLSCIESRDCASLVCGPMLTCVSPLCGDDVRNAQEECDSGGVDSARCDQDCSLAVCGDGYLNLLANEQCDDGNSEDDSCAYGTLSCAVCGEDCQFQEGSIRYCGDGVADAEEQCDAGGQVTDTCQYGEPSCLVCNSLCELESGSVRICGDGIKDAEEACDDGNLDDWDSCSNECEDLTPPSVLLGGTAFEYIGSALTSMGAPFKEQSALWLPAEAADLLIMSNDGGRDDAVDYMQHLNSGKHVLIIGGSNLSSYRNEISRYLSIDGTSSWHMSNGCESDWNIGTEHAMTRHMPSNYEFAAQTISYHMLHLTQSNQPTGVQLLGHSCHEGPDNHLLATRTFAGGGTLTYFALDFGRYTDALSEDEFVIPFLNGYLSWLAEGAP